MALPAVLHPIALTQSSDQVVHDISKEIITTHAPHSAGNLIKLELDALVAAVTERKEEAVVAHQELKLDESLTRIDVAVDQVLTEQSDTLLSPDRDEHVLQSHDLVRDNDDDASHYSDSDNPHGFEPCISSFSDPGHYSYSENPSHVAQQPAEHNDTTGRMHGLSDASLSSAEPTRPPLLTTNCQLSQQSDRHSSNRLDTALELAEREYGAASDLPPPIPPKSPLRDLRHLRPTSVHSTASSSSTLDEHTRSRQRSVRLAAAIGHRQAHTMSDPGHGSDAAGPSRFPARLNSQSTVNLRSKPIRQGGRATWAYSEYPPLDMVLEAQDQEGPVAFPTTSSHAASFISLGQYPSPSPRNPKSSTFGQDLSRYPTGLFDSLSSRSRGVSTYSQASSASHITFAALEHPRTRKISNKLRKGPNGRRKSSLSISTTLASEMAAHTPPISPSPLSAHFEPSSPKRRSPSPRSRQRKKSIFSRVFNFHRSKKSSATSRKSEKEYTVEPLQLPPPDQRISFASIGEEPESEDGGYGAETQEGSEDWRECWWKDNMKSQSEDGHAYGYGRGRPSANVLTIHPSPSASALLSTTTTSASATKQPTSSSRLASGHGDDTTHSFRGSWYDSMNDRGTFGTRRQQHQALVNHAFPGGGPRALTSRSPHSLPPNMEDGHGQRELLGLPAHPGHLSNQTLSHMSQSLQPPSPPPALSQPPPRPRHRVLVKRSRSNSIAFQQVPPVVPTPLLRPKMVAQLSSGSETTSSYTSHPSSGVWRGSLASTPSTSPGTSESHSSSACPPARPQSYFAELQMQMRDSGEFDPSSFDSRYPRIVKGSFGGNENGDDSLVASSTSTLKARAQNNASLASLTIMPAHAPTRKLTKRRPQAQKASSPGTRTHQRSRSVTFEDAALSAQLPSSPPGIDMKPSSRGRAISREGDTEDEKKRSTSRSKSVLRIKIRSPSCSGRHAGEDDGKGDEKVDYLPPVRPLEPLWIGNGMMLSPYSRYTYPSSTDDFYGKSSSHAPLTDSTTDALTSLAFTGNTGFLSSSALAALSSRLTNNGLYNDDPPRPSTPFLLSKDSEAFTFDPYAEEKENTTTDGKRDNKGTFGKKSKDATYKSSFSFLRIDSAAAAKSPEVHSVPMQVKQEEDLEGLDDLSALPKPTPRNRPKTKDDSPLRRWTLAMTDVSDEVLVQELEKMRMEARGPTRRKRRGNPKSPTTTSSSGGHTHTDSLSGEGDQKAIVCGGEEDAKWREELVRFRISQAERKPGDESDDESDDSQSESGELEDSPLEFTVMDDAGWKSARRALLCCRELVRTERSYQARLRQLLAGETETPPPALALSYVPALLRASEALLARLEDDPSAWGVSAAFVGVEEEVEAAFVAWCGIVGAVFEGGDASSDRPRKIVRSPKTSSIGRAESGSGAFGKRTTSSASLQQAQPESIYRKRQMSFLEEDPAESGANIGMFTAALGTGLAYNIAPSVSTTHQSTDEFGLKGAEKPLSSSLSISRALKRMTVFSSTSSLPPSPISPSAPPTVSSGSSKKGKKEKKPTVRELAIQPSQRVMRYVLQYRDLLAHTPTESPSRGLVERALESALRIAAKCDRAQGNATFLRNL